MRRGVKACLVLVAVALVASCGSPTQPAAYPPVGEGPPMTVQPGTQPTVVRPTVVQPTLVQPKLVQPTLVQPSVVPPPPPPPPPQPKPEVRPEQVYVAFGTVNVFEKPDGSSTKLASVSKGAALRVQAEEGAWYFVTTPDNKAGWVLKAFTSPTPPEQ